MYYIDIRLGYKRHWLKAEADESILIGWVVIHDRKFDRRVFCLLISYTVHLFYAIQCH